MRPTTLGPELAGEIDPSFVITHRESLAASAGRQRTDYGDRAGITPPPARPPAT